MKCPKNVLLLGCDVVIDVTEKRLNTITRVKRITELGTSAATSN
jgi:hypothetical protein